VTNSNGLRRIETLDKLLSGENVLITGAGGSIDKSIANDMGKRERSRLSKLAAIIERTAASGYAHLKLSCPPLFKPQDWSEAFRENLEKGILRFWIDHAIDYEYGGMFGWLDRNGTPIKPGTKSLVVQTRVLWMFSAAYQQNPQPIYQEIASHVLKFLREKMWDSHRGGFYWLVDRGGRLVEDKKQIYGQSFAMFGLAEYAQAFNDRVARQEALDLFHLVDNRAHDDVNGSYHQTYSSDWKKPLNDDRIFDIPGGKHQCAQTSLLEAFITLYTVTKDSKVHKRLEELLDISINKLVNDHHGYTYIHLTDDWRPTTSNRSSYGHDIKLSWLLTTAAEALGCPCEPKVKSTTLALVDHVLQDGFDWKQGGIDWEGPASGQAIQKQKAWWVQAEGLVGFLNAYQLTHELRYWKAFEQQARYVFTYFVDHRYGEWFENDNPYEQALGCKTHIWKEPYHQGRACLEIIRRLATLSNGDFITHKV
jgi:mannobiose 2-epimerase